MADMIVMYTTPDAGHLVSTVELANLILLHRPSLSVSILIAAAAAPSSSSSDALAPYISAASAAAPSISFHHIPAAPPPPELSPHELIGLNNPNLRKTLVSISQSPTHTVRALVLDFLCSDAFSLGAEFGVPIYYFFTTSAHGLASLLYAPTIHRNIAESLKDVRYPLDIPGFTPILGSDMPTVILDRKTGEYDFFLRTAVQMSRSAGIIVNTFDSLEENAIRALKGGLCVPDAPTPPIFCIGPVVRGCASGSGGRKHECLRWLDSQPERSVVFLCFGSLGLFPVEQLATVAAGLEKSGVRFLWVVHAPPGGDDSAPRSPDSLFPGGFLDRTKDRGLVVRSWAPQAEVLRHESVGGFVTHCGWNSVLESVCAGVPMAAWPLYREQRMNRVFLVEELRLAVAVNESNEDGFVSADELAERLSELIDLERGKALRERVGRMREGAAAALREGGSSLAELAALASHWDSATH